MSELKEILDRLPKLSVDELLRVRSNITMLLTLMPMPTTFGTDKNDLRDKEKWVLSAIHQVIAAADMGYQTVEFMTKSIAISDFRRKLPYLLQYLEKANPDHRSQRIVLNIGLQLLYADLFRIPNLLVTAPVMMKNIHRIPAAIEKEFPRYAQSNLLHFLARPQGGRHVR